MAVESMDVEPTDMEGCLHVLVATETKWNSLVTIDGILSLILFYLVYHLLLYPHTYTQLSNSLVSFRFCSASCLLHVVKNCPQLNPSNTSCRPLL